MSLLVGLQGTVDGWHGHSPVISRRATIVAALSVACVLPPTVTVAATPTDWRPQQPDRTITRALATANHQHIARAEAPEHYAVPAISWQGQAPTRTWSLRLQSAQIHPAAAYTERALSTPSVSAQYPDRTWRLTLPVAAYPAVARAESVEQFAVPALSWKGTQPETTTRAVLPPAAMQPAMAFADQAIAAVVPALSWRPSYPDTTARKQLTAAQYVSARAEAIEQFAVAALSWKGQYPDRVWSLRLSTATMQAPIAFADRDLAVFVPPLAWNGSWPDTTRRAALRTSDLPYTFRAEAVEQFTVPALSWQGNQPARVWSLRLQPAQMQASSAFADRDLAVFVPPLAWGPSYPDATRRASLHPSCIPFTFRAESLEHFAPKLLWSSVGPDRTWRLSLATSHIPAQFRVDVVVLTPALSWQPNYPPTTKRNALMTAHHPTLFKGEAVEQFAPKLLWNAFYPDTTRRARDISGAVRATSTTLWANWNPFATPPTADVVVMVPASPSTILVSAGPSTVQIAASPSIVRVTRTDYIILVPPPAKDVIA
jgi:hypothetical protein